MFARLAVLGLALLASGTTPQDRAPGVKRLVFVLEVDYDRAREAGWSCANRAEVLELAAKIVERRFVAMERAARVEVERDAGRIEVSLPSIDPRDRELFEEMLRSIGLCELFFFVDVVSAPELGIDFDAETRKLEAWKKANPDRPTEDFHTLGPEPQGPHRRLLWVEASFGGKVQPSPYCLLLPEKPEDSIGAASFEACHFVLDAFGHPAIAFDVRESRKGDLERVTEAHLKQRMAIVVGGKIVSTPQLDAKLVGSGLVGGQLGDERTEDWMEAFRKCEGPLRVVETR